MFGGTVCEREIYLFFSFLEIFIFSPLRFICMIGSIFAARAAQSISPYRWLGADRLEKTRFDVESRVHWLRRQQTYVPSRRPIDSKVVFRPFTFEYPSDS